MSKQPEALQLAVSLENGSTYAGILEDAAVELRRQHALIADLVEALRRVCNHGARTADQVYADWDNARAAIARAGEQQ